MHRRTVLKLAAGVAGAVTVGSLRPDTAVAAGPFTDVAGWPADARFDAIATGRSGSWAIGVQRLEDRPDGSWQRKAILRQLHRRKWVPVALPDDFGAWARAITPDATGVWIVGDRNDVSLPVADGSTVVGHLGRDGRWRSLDTEQLPAYCGFSSLALIDGRIELTGYAPTEGDGRPRPYCLTRPLQYEAAPWTERPVDAPVWNGDVVPSLKIGAGTTDWATADTWLFRRSGSGWAVVDGPPDTGLAWHGPCAVGGRSLYLGTEFPESREFRLRRRVGETWTDVRLPSGVYVAGLIPTPGGCWAAGYRIDWESETQDSTVIVLRVSGSKVVQRFDGPPGAADDVCRAGGKILLSGIVPDPRDPQWADWFGHSWSLRG